MTRLRALIMSIAIFGAAVGVGVSVAPQPAHAWTYTVTCWSTTGSPYVSGTGSSSTALQASLNCTKQLISKRWGISICGNAWHNYYSQGYYYGSATIIQNTTYCNYSRGNGFSTRGYVSSYYP